MNKSYSFIVEAEYDDGNVQDSNTASASTPDPVPDNLDAEAQSDSEIDLTWSSDFSGEDGFSIEEQQSDGSWSEVDNVTGGTYSDSVTDLDEGTKYTFRVLADYGSSQSSPSDTANATTDLNAPSDANADAVRENEANITWDDNASDEDGFTLNYSVAGTGDSTGGPLTNGAGTTITVPPNGTNAVRDDDGNVTPAQTGYALTGLAPGTTYDERIKGDTHHSSK